MPRKGEVRLATNLHNIKEALNWLEMQNRPMTAPIKTVLGGGATGVKKTEKTLAAFKTRLLNALKRKRTLDKKHLTLNVPSEEIKAFRHCYDGYFARALFMRTRWQRLALRDDTSKSKLPRGRPKLTRSQIAKRLSKDYHIGDRQKLRIRRADREARSHAEWQRGLRFRGETVLTDSVGRPKI